MPQENKPGLFASLPLFDELNRVVVEYIRRIVILGGNIDFLLSILAFDIEAFFEQLDLIKHLSPTRGNGLRSMVKRIQGVAQAA